MRNDRPFLLICDDDPLVQNLYSKHFGTSYNALVAGDINTAERHLRTHDVEVMILDVELSTPREGVEAIERFLAIDPELAIVMSSGHMNFDIVRDALKFGASDFVPKNGDIRELELAVLKVNRLRNLRKDQIRIRAHKKTLFKKMPFIGRSKIAQDLREFAKKLQHTDLNVVITGETGVGKEVFAHQLMKTSPSGETVENFVAIDSSTIQTSLAESMLFGHEKGAYTGANERKIGLFEQAHGGVIYFDEIGNMPLEIQSKLLRVLQEKTICRVGSQKELQLDFRVICASNRQLEDLVDTGQFKGDLLQRLSMAPVEIPPLRDRKEDIPELVEFFLSRMSPKYTIRFTPGAERFIQDYSWPGNIRELQNTLKYLANLMEGEDVDVADFPQSKRRKGAVPPAAGRIAQSVSQATPVASLKKQIENFERSALVAALSSGKTKSQIARELQLDRSNFYMKLKKYSLL